MRKEKLGAFFKGKGFYAALAVGTAAIFAVGILNTNMISNKNPSSQIAENAEQEGIENESSIGDTTGFTSENEVLENEVSGNGNEGTNGEMNEEDTNSEGIKEQETTDVEINSGEISSEKIAETEEVGEKVVENIEINEDEMSDLIEVTPIEAETIKEAQAEEPVAEVFSKESQISSLNFSEEDGLLWPVQGDILLEYSMDKPIYFKTLAQYKCNSAIVIEAKEKTEVFSAAKGVITDISNVDETGITVKASIGNDYEVIYGQLSEVQVKVGDVVEAGALIGMVGAPTKYYVEEGSNLYFKVLAGNEPVNPLLLLN